MKLLVLDTETIGVECPQVYELGYLIYDTANGKVLIERDYLSRQTWDNTALMATSYYKSKIPQYEKKIADGTCKKQYWGTIMRILQKDIEKYQPDGLYAYNSNFDARSIKLTSDLHKAKINPTADGIHDIMKMINGITETDNYLSFCEMNGYMTKHKKPRVRKTAEIVYRYISGQTDFIESHTALEDSKIELSILLCALGAE